MSPVVLGLLPEFAVLPELFTREVARDAARGRLRGLCEARGWRFEPGDDGRTAADWVDAARASACRRFLVFGRVWDRRAAELVGGALEGLGLEVVQALDAATQREALACPDWSWEMPGASVVDALALPATPPVDPSAWLAGRRVRPLLLPPGDTLDEVSASDLERVAGSAWALRLGWQDPLWPSTLQQIALRVAPSLRLQVDALRSAFAQATAPLEDAWGDGGLVDHNADLLVNIVPPAALGGAARR